MADAAAAEERALAGEGAAASGSEPDPGTVERIACRVEAVRERIRAAGGSGVQLIAVTKGHSVVAARAAAAAGLEDLGENYAKELEGKAEALAAAGTPARWHMIGQLQTNKVRLVAGRAAMVQTVDRPSLVAELARRAPGIRALVQVNLSGEPDRGGCDWKDAPSLVEAAREAGLSVEGLMGVAPQASDSDVRRVFARLAALREHLGLAELSMGMSGDLDIAVGEGATMVRIGTAIFGDR
jgi:pyridoxal phosphate enzyme (YggS family)